VTTREADWNMTPWMIIYYGTLVSIVSHLIQATAGQHQQTGHCANQCTIDVWTLTQTSIAVQIYVRFASMKAG
jgi:hypothetical protein